MSSSEDQQPPYSHHTATKILQYALQTTVTILPTTLFLTLLIFSYHTVVENGTVFLTNFIENDPLLKSLISSTNSTTTATATATTTTTVHRRNIHRQFLHLTRVGTLDDDFFSSDDVTGNRHLFGSHLPKVNSTFVPIGQLFQGIVTSSISFEFKDELFDDSNKDVGNDLLDEKVNNKEDDDDIKDVGNDKVNSKNEFFDEKVNNKKDDNNKEDVVNLGFVIGGLELGRRDVATLCLVISILSAGYGWMILGFVIVYSWAFGIVFVAVVNDLLGRYSSFSRSVWNGSSLGVKRLSGFILMRWAVRDGVTQILGLWFFGEIGDQYSFLKLFLRLKLMPFSVSSPWIPGYDKEISGFLFAWFLVDAIVSLILAVNSWVTIVNTRRGGSEIVKQGLYLLMTMIHQSIQLKSLELIFCGAFMRWVLARVCGRSLASLFQSFAEVYFMVVWLIYYFAARCKDASLSGKRFGRTELENLIEGLR